MATKNSDVIDFMKDQFDRLDNRTETRFIRLEKKLDTYSECVVENKTKINTHIADYNKNLNGSSKNGRSLKERGIQYTAMGILASVVSGLMYALLN